VIPRQVRAFVGFWYDFIVGDDWSVAVAVIAALALTYVVSTTSIPAWWILPTAIVILLPMSVWRVVRGSGSSVDLEEPEQ